VSDATKPGSAMDAQIAQMVFGRAVLQAQRIPSYSTDIRDAWDVVEHYRAQGWLVRVQEHPDGFPFYLALDEHNMPDERSRVNQRAMCLIEKLGPASYGLKPWACEGRGYGSSAPEAISRAALDLVENQHD